MSIVQNQSTIHGKQDIHSKLESMCTTLEKQIGGDTEMAAPNHSKRMQKCCRDGKFFEHVFGQNYKNC